MKEKSPGMLREIDKVAKELGGPGLSALKESKCVLCNGSAEKFDDELSKKEYALSGMCQACQDIAFAEPDEDQ